MNITFLGATQEVTGSKYLVEDGTTKILVDCGLHQGLPEIKKHNWDTFPVDPSTINAIVLTHAHLDHTGYIPALVKRGFKGKIYCSKATQALASIVLKDSGLIQQDDAKKAQASGSPSAQPLYTLEDAEKALTFFEATDYDIAVAVGSLKIRLIQSYHILGSSFVVISNGQKTVSFSGDLGRPNQMMMQSPPHLKQTDYLVLESTYGDKLHEMGDPLKELAEVVGQMITQKGVLIIPAFAIERTQLILYCLYLLRTQNIIPDFPIYLDSPMGIRVTNLFAQFVSEHTLSLSQAQDAFSIARYVGTIQESKHLDNITGPAIIIAGSGMADGGRVMDHLAHFISNPKNIVLFVGFQAEGTNGRALLEGADTIKIFDKWYPVHATIKGMEMFSAHADWKEILEWLSFFETRPKTVFLTHGELPASISLKQKIEERFGWNVVIPQRMQSFDLN